MLPKNFSSFAVVVDREFGDDKLLLFYFGK